MQIQTHRHQWQREDNVTSCIFCGQEWQPSTRKKYPKPPAGDYIPFDTYVKVLKAEQEPVYKLAYEISWEVVPRVDELNDFRPMDIDAGELKNVHTINNYRGKTNTFDTLPIPDFLHDHIMAFIKDEHIKNTDPIVDRHRTSLYQRMAATGIKTVNGLHPLHPHAIRRGGGIHMYHVNGRNISVPNFYYGHVNEAMTWHYLRLDRQEKQNAAMDYVKGVKGY